MKAVVEGVRREAAERQAAAEQGAGGAARCGKRKQEPQVSGRQPGARVVESFRSAGRAVQCMPSRAAAPASVLAAT